MAESLPDHDRIGGKGAIEHTEEIDIDYLTPLFEGEVSCVTPNGDARIVEEVIEAAV